MKKKINLLIVDDHHLMVEAYLSIISDFQICNKILIAKTCKQALELIKTNDFDLILLDLNLPGFPEEKIFNGQDLIEKIRLHCAQAKVLIITSHMESLLLADIVKNANPDGVILKCDCTAEVLKKALTKVIGNEVYYSSTLQNYFSEFKSNLKYLDNYNRQIILLLSQGIKTKNLINYLPLSISAIEKRKTHIKDFLGLQKGSDEDIIREARRLNLI